MRVTSTTLRVGQSPNRVLEIKIHLQTEIIIGQCLLSRVAAERDCLWIQVRQR